MNAERATTSSHNGPKREFGFQPPMNVLQVSCHCYLLLISRSYPSGSHPVAYHSSLPSSSNDDLGKPHERGQQSQNCSRPRHAKKGLALICRKPNVVSVLVDNIRNLDNNAGRYRRCKHQGKECKLKRRLAKLRLARGQQDLQRRALY